MGNHRVAGGPEQAHRGVVGPEAGDDRVAGRPVAGDRLPATIRLAAHRTVLALGPHARLIGLDPATALAVEDLSEPLVRMLDELTGPVDRAGLVDSAVRDGADPEQVETLLHRLLRAGAIVDAAGPTRLMRCRAGSVVHVVGDGPLAVGVAAGLALGGVGTIYLDARGTVVAGDLGTGYLDADRGHERTTAAPAAVARLVPSARTGPPPQRLRADLVILADSAAPGSARIARLLAHGTAHLLVHLRDGVGVVGPLVLPRRTPCLGCLERHRCAQDPAWLGASVQLVGRTGQADPACVTATAALGAAQALAALDGDTLPPALAASLVLDPTAATVVRRTWTAHPDCACRAGVARTVSGPAQRGTIMA